MTSKVLASAVAMLAFTAAGCTESKRANQAATFADRPADVTCWTFGSQIYDGRSTGKVEYSDSGRVTFVDAANGRLTAVEGDCRIVYLGDDADDEREVPPPPPPPPPAEVPGKPTPST